MIPEISDCKWVAVADEVLHSVQTSYSYSCRGSSIQCALIQKYFIPCSSLDVNCQRTRFCHFASKQYSSVAWVWQSVLLAAVPLPPFVARLHVGSATPIRLYQRQNCQVQREQELSETCHAISDNHLAKQDA